MNSTLISQSSLFSAPVNQHYDEYLLVMNPDEMVSNDVAYNRKKTFELIGAKAVNNVLPHISIAHFFAQSDAETGLTQAISKCLKGRIRSSFVWLEDFGCAAKKGALFINPKPKSFFNDIIKAVYPAISMCQGLDKSKNIQFNKDPHVTIAKGLNPAQLTKAWTFFKQKKYENKFIADKLTLLRRSNDNSDYALVAEFKL